MGSWFEGQHVVLRLALMVVMIGFIMAVFYKVLLQRQYASIKSTTHEVSAINLKIKRLQAPEESTRDVYSKNMIPSSTAAKTLKVILKEFPGLTLRQFKIIPATKQGDFYEHDFQIVFMGNYENTMEYMHLLHEKEPRLYWKLLDYKASNYPQATVTLQIAVINQEPHWFEVNK